METRATLRPGQKGTKKLVERFGERLLCVRYLYDADAGRQYKTVELIISSAPWQPKTRNPRRRDEDIVAVRIAYGELELRERAKRLGAVWRPAQKTLGDHLGRRETPGCGGTRYFSLTEASRKASTYGKPAGRNQFLPVATCFY